MDGRLARGGLLAITRLNARLKSAAVRLTRLTGKSSVAIHPKHLARTGTDDQWYGDLVSPGSRLLDAGCGDGMHCVRATNRGAACVGIDIDLRHLRTAALLCGEYASGTPRFVHADLEGVLPFKTGEFDTALLLDVIEHIDERTRLLRDVHRLLRGGGVLLLSAPNRETSWKKRLRAAGLGSFADPDHKVEYTWCELVTEIHGGGFEPQGSPATIVYDTPLAGLIDLLGGLSLPLYRCLSRWKVHAAQRCPQETTGWRVVCRRVDG